VHFLLKLLMTFFTTYPCKLRQKIFSPLRVHSLATPMEHRVISNSEFDKNRLLAWIRPDPPGAHRTLRDLDSRKSQDRKGRQWKGMEERTTDTEEKGKGKKRGTRDGKRQGSIPGFFLHFQPCRHMPGISPNAFFPTGHERKTW